MVPEAPSAEELQANPVVQAAFAAAWADSFPEDKKLRHEEGGYIFVNLQNGEILIRRARPGSRDLLDLASPPILADCYLIATYHTHPNPISEGWNPDPSDDDRLAAIDTGVPWFVVSEYGICSVGPARRVGGLAGPGGYPQ